MTSLSLPSFFFFSLNFSSLRAACYPGVSLSVACVASVSLRFRSKERGVEERERRVQIVGTGVCFKNRTCFLLFVFYFSCLLLFFAFCCVFFSLYKIVLECKQIVLFPSRQSPLSSHHLYNVGSLRSKRFQSSYCAKVRAGAKKKKVEGGGGGEKSFLLSPPPPPSFLFFFCSRPDVLDELARKRLLRRLQRW